MCTSLRPVRGIGLLLLLAASGAGAQAYIGDFSGGNEAPPTASAGHGSALLVLADPMLMFDVEFSGLSATTMAAHVHCCTLPGTNAGVAIQSPSLPGFPLGVTVGDYAAQVDLDQSSTYTSGFITASGGTVAGAKARLLLALEQGQAYVNIHTSSFPGGEIRANLLPEQGFADGFE